MISSRRIQHARETFARAFREDPGFRQSYLCNIAMVLYDYQPKGSRGLNMRKAEVRDGAALKVLQHILE